MSKCYICGKEPKVEIKLTPSDSSGALPNLTRILCGKCAVECGVIQDKEMATALIAMEENDDDEDETD